MSSTYTLSVECRLACSHVLPGCPPCDRLHGHTWTVRAYWDFDNLDSMGMGINFRSLKKSLQELIHQKFDHRHLNDIPPFDEIPPTTEHLAREVHGILRNGVDVGPSGKLAKVEIWEGPESCASYQES